MFTKIECYVHFSLVERNSEGLLSECNGVKRWGNDDSSWSTHGNLRIWFIVSYLNYGPSLVPRPLPDFISQPWRKIRRRPGIKSTSRTGNGGLGQYVTWTQFVLTESTISDGQVAFSTNEHQVSYGRLF